MRLNESDSSFGNIDISDSDTAGTPATAEIRDLVGEQHLRDMTPEELTAAIGTLSLPGDSENLSVNYEIITKLISVMAKLNIGKGHLAEYAGQKGLTLKENSSAYDMLQLALYLESTNNESGFAANRN